MIIFKLLVNIVILNVHLNFSYGNPHYENFGLEEKKCKPVPFKDCKDVGYNYTALPNLVGIEIESEAEYSLGTFKPLVKYGCSSQLQFLLCAFYAPMCTPQVPILIGPCRPLCEGVRDRCAPVLAGFGFPWPSAFNCSLLPPVNNEHHMCMEGPEETIPLPPTLPPPTPSFTRSRCAHLAQPQLHVYLNATGKCAPLCGADINFTGEDKVFAGVWMAIWGVATFCVGMGALATLVLDASLFKYPERAAAHICFCYALVAAGYLVRLGFGGSFVACRRDPELGLLVDITEGAFSTPCVSVFLLLYYFTLASGVWFMLYSVCCFLKAWRGISHDKFLLHSSCLHAFGWGVPTAATISCLVLRKVEADELTRTCYAGGYDSVSLVRWVMIPQFTFLTFGAAFVICSFALLWRSHSTLVRRNLGHGHVDVWAARVGVMSVLFMVPCSCMLVISFYELWNRDIWRMDLLPRPTIEIYMLKIFMSLAPGLFIGLFLVNSKVLDAWKRLWKRYSPFRPKRHREIEYFSEPPLIEREKAAVSMRLASQLPCSYSTKGCVVQVPTKKTKRKDEWLKKDVNKNGPETQL